jgi:transposase-like protein
MNCPRCGSVNRYKDGIVKGRQKYKCKDCKYHYTVEQRSNEKSRQTKPLPLKCIWKAWGSEQLGGR